MTLAPFHLEVLDIDEANRGASATERVHAECLVRINAFEFCVRQEVKCRAIRQVLKVRIFVHASHHKYRLRLKTPLHLHYSFGHSARPYESELKSSQ